MAALSGRCVWQVGLFLVLLGFLGLGEGTAQEPAVRVIAGADVLAIDYGTFAVREYLDVYNDYLAREITVSRVFADTWTGRRIEGQNEDWREFAEPVKVPGGQIRRVAERQRLVTGAHRSNWWVRWIRFSVETSVGTFRSNFVSSPVKPPGRVTSTLPAPRIDSLSAPRAPGRYSPPTPPRD